LTHVPEFIPLPKNKEDDCAQHATLCRIFIIITIESKDTQ